MPANKMKHIAAALTIKDREIVFGTKNYSALTPTFSSFVTAQSSITFYGGYHSVK